MTRTITVAAFIAERLQAMVNCDARITALPDGDPCGPFPTMADAVEAAQSE